MQVLPTVNYIYYPEMQAMRKPKQLSKDVILHGWYVCVQRRAYLQPLMSIIFFLETVRSKCSLMLACTCELFVYFFTVFLEPNGLLDREIMQLVERN